MLAAHICNRNSVVVNCSEQEQTGIAFVALFVFLVFLNWDVWFLELAVLCFLVTGEHATAAPATSDKQYVPECQRDTNGTERTATRRQERKLYKK
jgi:hypothetical protein